MAGLELEEPVLQTIPGQASLCAGGGSSPGQQWSLDGPCGSTSAELGLELASEGTTFPELGQSQRLTHVSLTAPQTPGNSDRRRQRSSEAPLMIE
jgi:hypothetical protein